MKFVEHFHYYAVGITTNVGDKNKMILHAHEIWQYHNQNVEETKPNHDGRHNGNSTTPDFFHRFIGG